MMNFKDGELSEEELQYVVAGVNSGYAEEMLAKLDKQELIGLKDNVQKQSKDQIGLSELDQVRAGMPLSYEEAKQDFEQSTGFGRK